MKQILILRIKIRNENLSEKKMSEKENGFISHLTELRQRLIHNNFLAILFVGCYAFQSYLWLFSRIC